MPTASTHARTGTYHTCAGVCAHTESDRVQFCSFTIFVTQKWLEQLFSTFGVKTLEESNVRYPEHQTFMF